jgi:hypothetical protein
MKNQEKLKALRAHLPIGIKQGLELLVKTDGNLDEAETLFKNELVKTISNQENISEETARAHLEKNNFDLDKTIVSIENEKFTLTELIVKRYKNKETVLFKVLSALNEISQPTSKNWIKAEEIGNLNSNRYAFAVILLWMDYEDFEGFDYALDYHLDKTIKEIKNKLALDEFANILQIAKERKEIFEANCKTFDDRIKAANKLHEDKVFLDCRDYYEKHKETLINRLYDFLVENVADFP